jgi:Tfp pilus assembly protein PilE
MDVFQMQKRNKIVVIAAIMFFFVGIVMYIASSASEELAVRFNEDSAVENLKNLRDMQSKYFNKHSSYADVKELCLSRLVQESLCDGVDQGYKFNIEAIGTKYTINAVPISYGIKGTGTISFFLDESGIIRGGYKEGNPASRNDVPIPEKNKD